jgi:hypothetical protein
LSTENVFLKDPSSTLKILRCKLFHGKTEAANSGNVREGFAAASQLLSIYAQCKRENWRANAHFALQNLARLESQINAHKEFKRNRLDALGLIVFFSRAGVRFFVQSLLSALWLIFCMSKRKIMHDQAKAWLPQACMLLESLTSS